jgi:hypothetical protein
MVFLIGNSIPVSANTQINDYLLAAQTEINNVGLSRSTAPDMNGVGSWVEAAQFRFNTTNPAKDFDIKDNSQSYEIRIKPKAWGQREVENSILKLRLKHQDHTYNHLLNLALKKRYLRVLEYLEQMNRAQYFVKLSELLKQEISLIRSQVLSDRFNAEKLLGSEEALQQTKGMIKLSLKRLNSIQSQLGIPLDNADSLRTTPGGEWVIKVPEINKITIITSEEDQVSSGILDARLRLQISKSENHLLQAKQQIGINLLKFEFSDSQKDDMAFQLGINIPLGSNFSRSESQYKLRDAQLQLINSMASLKQMQVEIKTEIAWLSDELGEAHTQSERIQQNMQKEYAKTNPFLMINLRKELIRYKKKTTDINQKVLNLYVSYLALSGQLTQLPLRNWIKHGTPELLNRTKFQ